jgi:hypothetical protein
MRTRFGTRYSLTAGVWSSDIRWIHRFARHPKAGIIWVNTFGPTDVRLPWRGSRDSGFGRDHGDMAIENFTEPKVVWISTGPMTLICERPAAEPRSDGSRPGRSAGLEIARLRRGNWVEQAAVGLQVKQGCAVQASRAL